MYKFGALLLVAAILVACSGGGTGPPNTIPEAIPNTATAMPATGSEITAMSTTPTLPYHITNWAYDEYNSYAQGSSATAAQVQQLLSFAESFVGNVKAQRDCSSVPKHCQSVVYFNPNVVYSSTACPYQPDATILKAASENWFVHYYGSATKRVTNSNYIHCGTHTPVYALNQNTSGVRTWWRNYLRANVDAFDIYLIDATGWTVTMQFYAVGGMCGGLCTTTQEFQSDASIVAMHENFITNLTHSNGTLMKMVSNRMPPASLFPTHTQFIGGLLEDYLISFDALRPSIYSMVLQQMAWNNITPAFTVLLVTGNSPKGSAQQITERFITSAAAWLGYSEGHVVVWKDLEWQTNGLSVWPEDLIYPSIPVQTMTSGPANIQVASGVWRREFLSCGYKGVVFGRCAAILNSNSSAITVPQSWLTQHYSHQVSVSGGDILSGGQVSLTSKSFTAGSTTVPAMGALLLTP